MSGSAVLAVPLETPGMEVGRAWGRDPGDNAGGAEGRVACFLFLRKLQKLEDPSVGAACPPTMPVTGLCGSCGGTHPRDPLLAHLVTPSFEHLLFIGGDQAETGINVPKYCTEVEKMSSVCTVILWSSQDVPAVSA